MAIRQILSKTLFFLLLLLAAFLVVVFGGRAVNGYKTRISEVSGIQEETYASIGGIEQFVQIRGEDSNNPIILVLHGGPGSPMSYYSYYWQTDLEDEYTIVHWDQRGSGRTFYANQEGVQAHLSLDLLISDLDELVDYLADRFGQEKIILLGHSWGTVLGASYCQQHPEKVASYIGVSQTIDSARGESVAVEEATRRASLAGDSEGVERIGVAYQGFLAGSLDIHKLMVLRSSTGLYLPSGETMSAVSQIWMGVASPAMAISDLKWYLYAMLDFSGFVDTIMPLFKQFFEANLYQNSPKLCCARLFHFRRSRLGYALYYGEKIL